jgi:hypothetical protein
MSLLGTAEIGEAFKGLFDVLGQWIPDKDKQAEIRAHLIEIQANVTEGAIALQGKIEELQAQIAIAALQSNLPTWVKALHLMGRQIHAGLIVLVVGTCHLIGKPIDPNVLMIMIAPGTVYTIAKGKGQ